MKVETDEHLGVVLKEVYNGVSLISDSDEVVNICMRDSGFEFSYDGVKYYAKEGVLKRQTSLKLEKRDPNGLAEAMLLGIGYKVSSKYSNGDHMIGYTCQLEKNTITLLISHDKRNHFFNAEVIGGDLSLIVNSRPVTNLKDVVEFMTEASLQLGSLARMKVIKKAIFEVDLFELVSGNKPHH